VKKSGQDFLETLKVRFAKNLSRHQGVEWAKVEARLKANAGKLQALQEMERTGAGCRGARQENGRIHLL
jgi:hypothetical protein